jgi:hypothetical protein
MHSSTEKFGVKASDVAAKVIDGEAIIINLSTGMYYSLDQVGAFVWRLVERQSSLEEMTHEVSEGYRIDSEKAAQDIQNLMTSLLEEGLISPADVLNGQVAIEASEKPKGGCYQSPNLMKYHDMAELFALDPPLPEMPNTLELSDKEE